MDDTPTVAEELVMALAAQLYRKRFLDVDDFAEISARLKAGASDADPESMERLEAAAHLANVVPFEAEPESRSEFAAKQLRTRFRLVPKPDRVDE